METRNPDQTNAALKTWKTGGIINYILILLSLLVYLKIVIFVFTPPHFGVLSPVFFSALIAGCLLVNRSMTAYQRYINSRGMRRFIGVLKWLLTIVLSLSVAGLLTIGAERRTNNYVFNQLQPVVDKINYHIKDKGDSPPGIDGFLNDIRKLRKISYYHDKGKFMIETPGPSVDIDGSILFYSSLKKKWNQIHNDSFDSGSPFYEDVKAYLDIAQNYPGRVTYLYENNNWNAEEVPMK